MQVDSIIQSAGGEGLNSPEPVGGSDLDKTAFLSLLVAQLKNQDPLEPMSNSEFVAQLAQFSSVEQLVGVNEGLNVLGVQQMGMANAQAATLIGNEVEVRSDKLQVRDGDASASAGFRLDGDAADVQVKLRDASGSVVRTIELGYQQQGIVPFEWDLLDDNGARKAPGTYRVDVVATDGEGNEISWESRVRGAVTGVNYDGGYPELVIGSIKASTSDIVGVYPPDEGGL
ncbi:MAG: flagellar hook assembly protein FlgD [Proteobacteria bacterium]|nr:flagellar hook assembly protein FlgD [Pseudomonadota bacterium]